MTASLHFAAPAWFWGLLLAPLIAWRWRKAAAVLDAPWRLYADAHLLPYLSAEPDSGSRAERLRKLAGILYWSLLWLLLLTALAGPRWEQREMRLAAPGDSLLILLDLSQSMEAADVAPSRLARARQEIQDLIEQNLTEGQPHLRLGLIAFASVPYVIAPISEDSQGLLNRLPALSTDLTRHHGSRLAPALVRAEELLAVVPDQGSRTVVLISDGDFDEPDLPDQVAALAAQGVVVQVLGVGRPEGAQVPTEVAGEPVLDGVGNPVRSALNETLLQTLAAVGGGAYQRADYHSDDTAAVLKAATAGRHALVTGDDRARIWQEAFHWPLIALALLLLPQWLAGTLLRSRL